MTDPPHTFMVYAHPSRSETHVIAKFRLLPNGTLGQASERLFRWDQIGDYHRIIDFVVLKRDPSEPPVFDILRDLFPRHREALDRVECEILMQPILLAAEANQPKEEGSDASR